MRFGAGMLVGVVVGTFLGAAVSAGAVSLYWATAGDILTKPRAFQNGYVAGVYDALAFARKKATLLASLTKDQAAGVGAQALLSGLNRDLACLNTHTDTLGDFTDWAVKRWTNTTHDDWTATDVMMMEGCL